MKDIVLQAEKRDLSTKHFLKNLRTQGRVPGVAYGDNGKSISLSLDEKSLQKAIHGERGRNALMTLELDGASHPVLVKELQRHPITRAIMHIDLHRVSLKKQIEAAVPVHTKGEAPGVKLGGGILEHIVREIRVRCLPMDIPTLDVDVSNLQVGQGIRAKDVVVPSGVELLIDSEAVLVNIVAPTILEEAPAAAAVPGADVTATGEPEVIKKGKTDEEGAAAPAAGDKKAAAPAAKTDAKK